MSQPAAKKPRATRTSDHSEQSELRSGNKFGAFHVGQLVSVVHRDEKHADVPLWRATVRAAHPDAGTYDVFLLEITKELKGVTPDLMFRPSLNLPAV